MAKTASKNKKVVEFQNTEVLESVADLDLDGVSSKIATTQVEVQNSLAELSARLIEQLQVLDNVKKTITLKREELQQLRDIEANDTTLDDLKSLIATTKQQWEEDKSKQQREFNEQRADRQRNWTREEAEYKYTKEQERKRQEEEFGLKMARMERDLQEKRETLEKDWAMREMELKKREQELVDLRTKVSEIPDLIKKEANAAVAIATNSVKKEYETKALLASKDAETAQKLAAQEVNSFQASITKLNAQVEDLKVQLEAARRDVKDISAKALDSASGRSAMEALQKVLEKDQPTKSSK